VHALRQTVAPLTNSLTDFSRFDRKNPLRIFTLQNS
jgi:hypothetical protein